MAADVCFFWCARQGDPNKSVLGSVWTEGSTIYPQFYLFEGLGINSQVTCVSVVPDIAILKHPSRDRQSLHDPATEFGKFSLRSPSV